MLQKYDLYHTFKNNLTVSMVEGQTNNCDLTSCFLCRNSRQAYLSKIAANRQVFVYKKGQAIFREGDTTSGIYFLTGGMVKIHRQWDANRELILRFCATGDILGHRGMGSDRSFTVTATALSACTTCYVDLGFFEESLQVDHRLTYNMLNFQFNELHEAEKRMSEFVHLDVRGRTANTLLMLLAKFGVNEGGFINVQLKRQDMAAYAGTTYESFFRVLDKFEKDGLIHIQGKNIQLLDPEKLKLECNALKRC